MKITKSQLKKIIKEELQEVVGPMTDQEQIEGSGFRYATYLLEDAERIYQDLQALSDTTEVVLISKAKDRSQADIFRKVSKATTLMYHVVAQLKYEYEKRG